MLTVLHGHNLAKLRELATGSVHCWITSPPYYGLRDYPLEPQVWGGDEKCAHEWGEWSEKHSEREKTQSGKSRTNQRSYAGDATRKFNGNHQKHTAGAFCAKCNAWLGSLGLEPNPELYVEHLVTILREARRVLRDDGTLWLNLGDSYAGSRAGEKREIPHYDGRDYDLHLAANRVALEPEQNIPTLGRRIKNPRSKQATNSASDFAAPHRGKRVPRGSGRWGGGDAPAVGDLKPKDLMGVPWLVAKALQSPHYTGRMSRESDRVWMAATIDAEGCICGFEHTRKDEGRVRTGIHITITNSSLALLGEAYRIWRVSRSEPNKHGEGHLGTLDTFRWIVHGTENKLLFLREIYPLLIVKRRQALLAYNLLLFSQDAKRLGKTAQKDAVNEKRSLLAALISKLNHAESVEIPDWCVEPPSVWEPGWWLRSRIPWIKRNCMPESCDDRPSTAIEDVFLLSKSPRYFYDAEAVAVPASLATHARLASNVEAQIGSARANGGKRANGNMKAVGRKMAPTGSGIKNNEDFNNAVCLMVSDRNRRNSDWFLDSWQGLLSNELGEPLALVINAQPFAEAHFATFPPRLVQPMILAGTSARGCCSKCGAPWERVTETGAPDIAHQRACGSDAAGEYTGEATKDFESARAQNASEVKARILRGMHDQKTVGWIPTCKCAGYAVRSTSSRRMAVQRVDRPSHNVEPNSKYTGRSNAGRVQSLRYSARARGGEYGSTLIVDRDLKGDQLDLEGIHHGQNQRRKEPGAFSNDKAARFCIEIFDSARARRRNYYRERWQERINAAFPKTVPCTVGDMFGGSGTSGEVALELGRRALLIELGGEYIPMIERRCNVTPSLALA